MLTIFVLECKSEEENACFPATLFKKPVRLSPKKPSLYTTAIKSVSTILLAAGYLVASLVLMMFLEPGITPPGFTGRGAYALVLIVVGGFHLSGRWRSTIPFMIFGAVAGSFLIPDYIGDGRLKFRLGDHSFSPEIWAAAVGWCIFVVSVSLLVRMTSLVRWRLIQDVPREHPACRYCGYDLRAAERICPECGTPFDCLRPLPRITEVHIDHSPLTGSGFAVLVPSPNLAALYMPGSRINDAGLAVIGKLHSLGDLQLDYTDVTDLGLTSLKQLGRLEYLRLDYTAITDVGLLSVADMRKLKYISVNGAKVTVAGVKRFKLLRPDVLVEGP